MIRVVHPVSRIRILTFTHPGSRIQGSKRHPIPDPGSGSATSNIDTAAVFTNRQKATFRIRWIRNYLASWLQIQIRNILNYGSEDPDLYKKYLDSYCFIQDSRKFQKKV
jgi:hypothetical protein